MATTKKTTTGEIACSTCEAANLAAATFCRHCRATGAALHGAKKKATASKKAKRAK